MSTPDVEAALAAIRAEEHNPARPLQWVVPDHAPNLYAQLAAMVEAHVARENMPCGQRAVLCQGLPGGFLSGSCIEPHGHGPHHHDAAGNYWTESVR